MTLTRDRIALNPLQWVTAIEESAGSRSPDGSTSFADPMFLPSYRHILQDVRRSGFRSVMMKIPVTQTLQGYLRMTEDLDLKPAPGYVQVTLPEDEGVALRRGSAQWFRWFDSVRRRAEESRFCGLDSVFLASDIQRTGRARVDEAAAVGTAFDQDRLERVTELIGDAAEVLRQEGIRAGLHNHVGTWVETEYEIEYVLATIDSDLLGAGFDVGHLAWAGIDATRMVSKYADRLVGLHIKDIDATIATASRSTPTSYPAAAQAGLFLEPGLGDIDLVSIIEALPEDFGGWVIVEVDRASMAPFASAQQSWQWVEEHVEENAV